MYINSEGIPGAYKCFPYEKVNYKSFKAYKVIKVDIQEGEFN